MAFSTPRSLSAVRPLLPCLLLLALAGCSSLLTQSAGAGAGIGGAAVANAVTSNGALTAGIGLGAQAAATAGVQYLEKRVHGAEQNEIARVAGTVPVGGVSPWRVVHDIPIEDNHHGEVTVTRLIEAQLPASTGEGFVCKEIVFSIDAVVKKKPERNFYTATVCDDGKAWKWATAEPATARWGSLQ